MVVEKSWDMKNKQKVKGFDSHSWNFTYLPINITKCMPYLLTLRNIALV